jgi:hypothetical protein
MNTITAPLTVNTNVITAPVALAADAYQLALREGFVGTRAEWLASLAADHSAIAAEAGLRAAAEIALAADIAAETASRVIAINALSRSTTTALADEAAMRVASTNTATAAIAAEAAIRAAGDSALTNYIAAEVAAEALTRGLVDGNLNSMIAAKADLEGATFTGPVAMKSLQLTTLTAERPTVMLSESFVDFGAGFFSVRGDGTVSSQVEYAQAQSWSQKGAVMKLRSDHRLSWYSGVNIDASGESDAHLTKDATAAATLQMGLNHNTVATNQTFKAHDVTTGTGGKMTIAGGRGSAAGGAVVIATCVTNGMLIPVASFGADGVTTLAKALPITSGGTGGTTPSAARTELGLESILAGKAKSVDVFDFTRESAPVGATGGNGVWSFHLPEDARLAECWLISSGAGGGSGCSGDAGTDRTGGGGGASGGVNYLTLPVSQLGSSLIINVGAGGNGGAASGSVGAPGVSASSSQISGLCSLVANPPFNSAGRGGGFGAAVNNGTNSITGNMFNGVAGGNGTNGASSSNGAVGSAIQSGRGGGGINSSNVVAAGGSVLESNTYLGQNLGGHQGAAGGGPAGGGAGVSPAPQDVLLGKGAGGGGSSIDTAGGDGGNGYRGGGGGGGGASQTGFLSGAGGNGGDGFVRLIIFY